MLNKIEAMRKKPKHVRNRHAFWIALCVTLLIALFWITTLPARFAPPQETGEIEQAREEMGNFSRSAKELFSRAFSAVASLRSTLEDTQETATSSRQTLDLDALVASSTTSSMQPKIIQIGTSTAASASSTSKTEASSTVTAATSSGTSTAQF